MIKGSHFVVKKGGELLRHDGYPLLAEMSYRVHSKRSKDFEFEPLYICNVGGLLGGLLRDRRSHRQSLPRDVRPRVSLHEADQMIMLSSFES